MAAPNARAAMMATWGLPLEVPDAAFAGMLPDTRESVVLAYARFRHTLAKEFKKSQKRGGVDPLGTTIGGFPVALPERFSRDLKPEEFLVVHAAYLKVLRACLQQKRLDTAEQVADAKRDARKAAVEPSDEEVESDEDEAPTASSSPPAHVPASAPGSVSGSDKSDPGSDSDSTDEDPADSPRARAPAAAAAPPLAPAPAAPDLAPVPAAKRARVAPAPEPVPSPVDAMLGRLTPDRIGAFVLRLEVPKWKKDADKASFLLNDLLGTDYRDLNCFPNAVTKRFKAAMTERGYDLKVVGNVGEHFRVRETGKPVRLQRQARRPTGLVFCGDVWWVGGGYNG